MTRESAPIENPSDDHAVDRSAWSVFRAFLRLGCTSFGGPVAHIGYFRDEFVTRRRWLNDATYADWVALCQFLPGPASSQVGLTLGLMRAGYRGALAAWLGFTLPSAVLMVIFAIGLMHWGQVLPTGALAGLKIVAVAVVAQAVWGMAKNLCTDVRRISIMAAACIVTLSMPSAMGQIGAILAGGIAGLVLFRATPAIEHIPLPQIVTRRSGLTFLAIFLAALIALPIVGRAATSSSLAMIDVFYRTGSLVFGGGHVMLPLLQAEVVPAGWVNRETFLAGYGAAQALPGPLFTFAAFLGASSTTGANSLLVATICLLAIFVPSFLLVAGALPFWESVRRHRRMQTALAGINASVVGLLLAALYDPVWTSAIHRPTDFALALAAWVAMAAWKCPPWLAVILCGTIGAGICK